VETSPLSSAKGDETGRTVTGAVQSDEGGATTVKYQHIAATHPGSSELTLSALRLDGSLYASPGMTVSNPAAIGHSLRLARRLVW